MGGRCRGDAPSTSGCQTCVHLQEHQHNLALGGGMFSPCFRSLLLLSGQSSAISQRSLLFFPAPAANSRPIQFTKSNSVKERKIMVIFQEILYLTMQINFAIPQIWLSGSKNWRYSFIFSWNTNFILHWQSICYKVLFFFTTVPTC